MKQPPTPELSFPRSAWLRRNAMRLVVLFNKLAGAHFWGGAKFPQPNITSFAAAGVLGAVDRGGKGLPSSLTQTLPRGLHKCRCFAAARRETFIHYMPSTCDSLMTGRFFFWGVLVLVGARQSGTVWAYLCLIHHHHQRIFYAF